MGMADIAFDLSRELEQLRSDFDSIGPDDSHGGERYEALVSELEQSLGCALEYVRGFRELASRALTGRGTLPPAPPRSRRPERCLRKIFLKVPVVRPPRHRANRQPARLRP
jgi:hypothetical protein